MPLPINQIGPYQFIRLDGVPLLPREEADIITRPGVPGTGFMRTAKRGKQFSLRSTADVVDWTIAQNANLAYHSLTNQSLVDVIFGNINYATIGVRFNVLDVEVTDIKPIHNAIGGLVAGRAIIVANWQLIGVAVTP